MEDNPFSPPDVVNDQRPPKEDPYRFHLRWILILSGFLTLIAMGFVWFVVSLAQFPLRR